MCGICGMVDFGSARPTERLLGRMVDQIEHRGPDDCGVFVSGPAGLGHTRLSIIDLSPLGHQPMKSADGNYVLVYNGEIYNFAELRTALQNEGVQFRSRSDTEVVLNAYIHWGTGSFAMLKGMFGFALWDQRERRLHLARDRFGIKPLYYAPTPSGIVFGSEIKAMLASDRVGRKLSYQGLSEYMYYGTALREGCLFDEVKKLLPGHRLTLDESGLTTEPFVDLYDTDPPPRSVEEATEGTRDLLRQAVASHLVSDVPVGVFLSGGIDSSAVTALASEHYGGQLKTYSVGFDFELVASELPKARRVAEHCGTDHHELHIAGGDLPDVIRNLVRCHDQPFGDAAGIPLYLLCRELGGSVKVILQGDGGDEIFAGYRRYNVLSAERAWHRAAQLALPLGRFLPRSPAYYRRMRFLAAMHPRDPALRLALLMTEEPHDSPPARILSREFRERTERHDPFLRYREFHERLAHLDPVQRGLYTDCGILLPDIFLEKVDKSTMAHGIEVRVPFLDVDLTRYVMGLPSNMKVRRGQKKWLLRRALRGIVPDDILDGPKTGFGVPYQYWLREPLREFMRESLSDRAVVESGLFDSKALAHCIDEHVNERRNNGFLLWKMLNLSIWLSEYSVSV